MAVPINRGPFNALVDDDGSGTVGTIWNKSQIAGVVLDPVDVALATKVDRSGTPVANQVPYFTDDDTVVGNAKLTFNPASGLTVDAELRKAIIRDYAQMRVTVSITGGVLTLDCSLGNVFTVNSNANINTFSITNWPASPHKGAIELWLLGNGTTYSQNWGSIRWPSGTPPVLTTANGYWSVLTFHSFDSIVYGIPAALAL